MMRPDAGPYLVSTAAVAVENTHNFGGGTVQPLDELRAAARGHRRRRRRAAPRRRPPLERPRRERRRRCRRTASCSTRVSVCLSKGLGAPVGSLLVSSAERVAAARGVAQAARRRDAPGRHPRRGRALRARPPRRRGWPTTTRGPGGWPTRSPRRRPGCGRPRSRRDQHRGARGARRGRPLVAALPRAGRAVGALDPTHLRARHPPRRRRRRRSTGRGVLRTRCCGSRRWPGGGPSSGGSWRTAAASARRSSSTSACGPSHERLLRVRVDVDDDAVGADRDRRPGQRHDEVAAAAGVRRVDDHRQVRQVVDDRARR